MDNEWLLPRQSIERALDELKDIPCLPLQNFIPIDGIENKNGMICAWILFETGLLNV
jgi:hypothetical protein